MLPAGAFTALLLLWSTGTPAETAELAFPPVELREEDSGISVSFTHPFLFYQGLKKSDTDAFNFTVSTDFGHLPSLCPAREDICRRVIWFPEGAEKCLRVSRWNQGEGIAFKDTGRICLSVSPPANFSLSCQNLKVVASWTHSHRRPLTFRVHIGGSAGHFVNRTSDHRYDLSSFVWAAEERYMGFHSVTVTAVDGENQSAPASATFTFNDNRVADNRCLLDFPPVDLTKSDSGATVRFMNPFHFYKELKDAKEMASFSFTASSDSGHFTEKCPVEQEKCKLEISFPEGKDKCIRLEGFLIDRMNIGKILFNETDDICASSSTEIHAIMLAIILFTIIIIIIIVLMIIICKVKAWTLEIPSTPKHLMKVKQHQGTMRFAPVSDAEISELIVHKSCKKPSVSSEEDQDLREKFQDANSAHSDLPPTGMYTQGDLSEGYGGEENSTGSSVKTISSDLEEEEEVVVQEEEEVVLEVQEEEEEKEEVLEVGAYDCPHNLQVDLGDGEMVSAYKER